MRILVCNDSFGRVSETFIQTHVDGLGPDVETVELLDHLPAQNGRHVVSQKLFPRAARKAGRMIRRAPWRDEIDGAFAAAFRDADVVLAEYGTMGVRVLEGCRRAGTPLVVHFHGYDASRYDVIAKYRAGYGKMFAYASAVIAVSRRMRADLIELGCPAEKLVLNPYGIDFERFSPVKPADNPPTFVAVGRLVDKKAPHLLLLAFERVFRKAPQAKLRIIGDGPLKPICEGIVRATGLTDAVTLLGSQPHERVAQEMASARGFVQHSVVAPDGDSEGTPVAVLEASASGLPVVATRHAGIPDAVLDEETGLLVDEYDIEGMAERMLRLVDSPADSEDLGRAGHERISRCYGRDTRLLRLRSVLQAAASNEAIPYLEDDGLATEVGTDALSVQGATAR